MKAQSVEWLRDKGNVKKPIICGDGDRQHVGDPEFEHWKVSDGIKRPSMIWAESLIEEAMTDEGFTFFLPEEERTMKAPFTAIRARGTEWFCPWSAVTAIYQGGEGQVFIFVREPA